MTVPQKDQPVDVSPFAARAFWAGPACYEIWWEDPRDVQRVTVETRAAQPPRLEYWRSSWPEVRVPKGAVVGAGESGWLANDDWTNGNWQPAHCTTRRDGTTWIFEFQPLNRQEFPELSDFPAAFRRTLKVRLCFEGGASEGSRPEMSRVEVFTDSIWREAEVALEWRGPLAGHLEAFNGQVLGVSPLNSLTEMHDGGGWASRVSGGEYSGVHARVHFAANEDPNSFDRTILTLRADFLEGALPGVSFFLDEILEKKAVYVRDLGVLARLREPGLEMARFEAEWEQNHTPTLYEQIGQREEQTWEQAWANQPRKKTRMYYTLGCEGSRQKFATQPNGDVFMTENFIKVAPGKDTPRLAWDEGELQVKLGFPAVEPGLREIEEGYLPVIRTVWMEAGVVYEQEAYATWLWGTTPGVRREGDDPVIAMLQVRLSNLTSQPRQAALQVESCIRGGKADTLIEDQGWITTFTGHLRMLFDTHGQGRLSADAGRVHYQGVLRAGEAHTLTLKLAHLDLNQPEERARIAALDYAAEKQQVLAYWRERTHQGAQLITPNQTLDSFYRTHLMHMLVINDREPGADRQVARCGGFYYGSFPDEGCMAITDLDRRGYHAEAER
ncbi:MAG TPA: hypothetical protein PJ988_13805, partial [Anaerolinea sp.]|nr:hypothetical protein [Anaerolinea sp.]